MRIKIEVYDVETGETLEELGECLTDSPARAVQMYDEDVKWCEKGYNADIRWKDITNEAARTLGRIKSEKKAAANRDPAKANKPPKEGKLPRGRQLGSKNTPKDKGAA